MKLSHVKLIKLRINSSEIRAICSRDLGAKYLHRRLGLDSLFGE